MRKNQVFLEIGFLILLFFFAAIFIGIYPFQKNGTISKIPLPTIANQGAAIDAVELSNSLQGWWKFDEMGGDTTKDSAKNNIQGALSGGPVLVPGKIGSALSFDGIDDVYTAPLPPSLSSNITIALWVNISTSSPQTPTPPIVSASPLGSPSSSPSPSYLPTFPKGAFVKIGSPLSGIGIGVGAGRFDYPGEELIGLFEYSRWIPSGKKIPEGWHHVAIVTDALRGPDLYLDGTLLGSFPGNPPVTPRGEIKIGGYMGEGDLPRYARALIDDVRVYSKALTPDEIAYIMTNTTDSGNIRNNAPIAVLSSFAIDYETAKTISVSAMDPDPSDTLTYAIVTQPLHGTLTKGTKINNNNQEYLYTPAAGYSGKDSFKFSVRDNKYATAENKVSLTIKPPSNHIPVAENAAALTLSGTPITLTLSGTDADAGDNLSVVIVTNPGNGALSNFTQVTPRQVRYTYWPTAEFTGIDSFTFKWNDGKANSNIGTAAITVNSNGQLPNNIPTASNASALTLGNTPITVTLSGTDTDAGDNLSLLIVNSPAHGALSNFTQINPRQASYTYWPTASYSGSDSFTFKWNDGKADSNIGTASITINPSAQLNTSPNAVSFSSATPKNTAMTITLLGSDADNDPLSYSLVTNPGNGILSLLTAPNVYRYTPNNGYIGWDSFTYKVNDGKVDSNIATASLNTTDSSSALQGAASYPLEVELYAYDSTKRKPADQSLNLQQALDKYTSLRLENKDYTTLGNAPSSLTIYSNQKLYGLPDTKVPSIIVSPGTHNALLSRLRSGTLTFPASSSLTSNNVFKNFAYTSIVIDNATLEDNTFLDFNFSQLNADTRTTGYLRNNRFIRFRSQTVSPQVTIRGNISRPSYGNVFVGFNILTPLGEGVIIEGQKDITFAGGDAESWNYSNLNTMPLFTANNTSLFTIYGLNGGGGRTGMFNVGADTFRLIGSYINSSNSILPNISLLPGNRKTFLVSSDQRTLSDAVTPAPGVTRFKALQENLGFIPNYNGTDYTSNVPPAVQTEVQSLMNPGRVGVQWEAPTYEAIPDPGGANWNTNLSSKVATTSSIQQNYIDKNQILPPGTYYIDAPLYIDSTHMLWGSGANNTVIIAKNSSFDVVKSSAHRNGPDIAGARIVVGDITLQGGQNGIHLDTAGAGFYAQINEAVVSNVTMRNMQNAGIFVDAIYAIDNVFFDHVNIVNSGYGLRQQPPTGCVEAEAPGITYIDKLFFYQSQFVGNNIGFELPACRTNNANVCINCLFKDNATAAVRMKRNNSPFFINSDFVNNGGSLSFPTISNTNTEGNWSNNLIIINSRFDTGSAQAVLGAHRVDVEGSVFRKGVISGVSILGGSERATFFNNTSNFSAGQIRNGLFLNNSFPTGDNTNNQAIYFENLRPSILIPGAGTPAPQLLFGSQLSNQ